MRKIELICVVCREKTLGRRDRKYCDRCARVRDKKYQSDWYQKHKKQVMEYNKTYKEVNRERVNRWRVAYDRKRRRAMGIMPRITQERARELVLTEKSRVCGVCNKDIAIRHFRWTDKFHRARVCNQCHYRLKIERKGDGWHESRLNRQRSIHKTFQQKKHAFLSIQKCDWCESTVALGLTSRLPNKGVSHMRPWQKTKRPPREWYWILCGDCKIRAKKMKMVAKYV